MKLWLLRHARVDLAPGLCYGATDVAADPAHTRQAAEALAPLLPGGVPVWVSGLGRAWQLAQALHSLRPDLRPDRQDLRLNEMDFGRWELQRWGSVPRAAFDAWMADFAHHRFGGAESTQAVLDRVGSALADARANGGEEMVWVTHAGVIRAVQFLVAHGGKAVASAAEWPVQAPEPGGHLCLVV